MEYHQQGLHHGDLLICTSFEEAELKNFKDKIITVVQEAGIVTRRLSKITEETIELTSDDPNYPAQIIDKTKVFELWLVRAVFSTYLNPPTLLEERVLKLEKTIASLNTH